MPVWKMLKVKHSQQEAFWTVVTSAAEMETHTSVIRVLFFAGGVTGVSSGYFYMAIKN